MEHLDISSVFGQPAAACPTVPVARALLLDASGLVVNAVVIAQGSAFAAGGGLFAVTDAPEWAGIGWRRMDGKWIAPQIGDGDIGLVPPAAESSLREPSADDFN